jgi:hypothetical protein
VANAVTATNWVVPLAVVPANGFANAALEQLNIVQGSAAGDLIALVQLPANATTNESLTISGTPFTPGAAAVPGTLTVVQQDVAGHASDFLFLGSYTPGTGPFGPPGSPPYAYTNPLATGSITAMNEVVIQGNASGDILSVLFNTMTSPSTALSSVFIQGNGGGDASFQRNTAVTGGLFNFSAGSGTNYVQVDSNNAIGTFDGGPSGFGVLGQDNNNSS